MSRARSGPRARLRLPGVPAAPRPPPSRGPRRPRRRLPTARGGPPGPPALEGAPLPVPLPALGWRRRVSPGGAVPCGAPRGGIPVGPGPAAGAESRQPDDRRQPEQRLASRRPAPAAAPRLLDLRPRLQRTGRREGRPKPKPYLKGPREAAEEKLDLRTIRSKAQSKFSYITSQIMRHGRRTSNGPGKTPAGDGGNGREIHHQRARGTTPRTKKIPQQQAAKGKPPKPHVLLKTAGLQRTSVFDRLGAEAKADTATGGKPAGVFSRLGDALGTDGDKATESDDDCSVLQYAGVLKKLAKPPPKESSEPGGTVKAKATSSETKPVPVTAATQRPGRRNAAGSRTATKPSPAASKIGGVSVVAVPVEAQGGDGTSTKDKSEPEFWVRVRRTWGPWCPRSWVLGGPWCPR
ncbi:uncharacterized protein LOC141974110 isoform X2 [Athene noctua]|uniref:uncharacterized protein LOC141974110 isoform X2 n=1 Tax=Athene noctua TaxID=126797 RepID=UPI003EBB7580